MKTLLGTLALLLALSTFLVLHQKEYNKRSLSANHLVYNREVKEWKLPAWGSDTWCNEPMFEAFDFRDCNQTDVVNIIPLVGGLTNALKIILLGAVKSMQEGKCFTIDESVGHLKKRNDEKNRFPNFIQRYFEPIGLEYNDPIVKKAMEEGRTYRFDVVKDLLESPEVRMVYHSNHTIEQILSGAQEGHFLKKVAMRRLWRPLPKWRESTCHALEKHGLENEYIALSVRRGDKKEVEHMEYAPLDVYIDQAEKDIAKFFDGVPPKIFVATDDCSVMDEFREFRPEWTFVSECENEKHSKIKGFALKDVGSWTPKQTDEHFRKFFKELYAMALSRIYIGTVITNVAWWVYFMRPDRHSFKLIDIKNIKNVDMW